MHATLNFLNRIPFTIYVLFTNHVPIIRQTPVSQLCYQKIKINKVDTCHIPPSHNQTSITSTKKNILVTPNEVQERKNNIFLNNLTYNISKIIKNCTIIIDLLNDNERLGLVES